VVQPVQGAIENGAVGFASGIAKGIVGMPVKFWAGKQVVDSVSC